MRVPTDRFFRALPALLVALGIVAGPAPQAHAAAYTYGARQRTVNAGVLILDDTTAELPAPNGQFYAPDPDPYVFYVIDERQDLKPFGWSIVNPIAPANVTGDILTAWNARASALNITNSYFLNETITPSMAAYWEVSLAKTSLTDLEKFDVLYLNISQTNEAFTDAEVQNLRRYVDNGGQLWIEGTGGTINSANPLFLDVSFNTTANTASRILPGFNIAPLGYLGIPQPIVQSPYLLTPTDLDSLGTPNSNPISVSGTDGTAASIDTTILSSVAITPNFPVISAGQLGAGQVIVDSVGTGANINNSISGFSGTTPNDGPLCDPNPTDALTVPASDLKFAYDILSWASAHPNEYKNSHQSSQSAATLGPALTPTWTFPVNGSPSATTPGAAISGNFVYVRTADGYLRAFNATPGTDIIGTGNPDAGFTDYAYGAPYDEVWDTAGTSDGFAGVATMAFGPDPLASAPTVATFNGTPYVFIESAAGKIYRANAVTGAGGAIYSGTGNTSFPTTAPAPTYYAGRLFAGEPDGSLYVYDLGAGQGKDYVLNSPSANTPPPTNEHVMAPPTVGLVRESVNGGTFGTSNGSGSVDDIVVTVTTNLNTYTVHAGAWHDPLSSNNGAYNPGQANSYGAFDILPVGTEPTYNDNANGYQVAAGGTATATGWTFGGAAPIQPVFGDYIVDFFNTTAGDATRAAFGIGAFLNMPTSAAISAPALDSNGNFYYTVNVAIAQNEIDSTLVCAHDSRSSEGVRNTKILWRYRLPFMGENDLPEIRGTSVIYDTPLDGFQFVGAPVVDNQGNVFALATNPLVTPNASAVLCFTASYSPYITLPVTNADGPISITQLTQPVATTTNPTSGPDEFGNPAATAILGGTSQFNGQVDNNGNMTIQNFAGLSPGSGGQAVTPNLSEPQSVQATYTLSATGGTSTNTVTATMHSNLNWYALLPGMVVTPSTSSGLTLQGDYLFFAANTVGSTSNNYSIYRLYAYPQGAGLVNSALAYNTAGTPNGRAAFASEPTQAGAINGVLSGGNGVLIANGSTGIAAFGTKYTLVSDANRVMEVDSDGIPSWLVDSTAEINPATRLITHLALNHPTSITQVTANDYLVADTGNNRCVRFDRAGNVIWELSRFNDVSLSATVPFFINAAGTQNATKTQSLLAPGEPTTLNHPTSVTSYVQTVKDSSGNLQGTIVHYLIADTGNSRIVEVVDAFDKTGTPVGVPHDLVWVSRTADVLGRHYAYTGANYFDGPNGLEYIVALVTNAAIAPVTTPGSMAPASDDGRGSSIVRLDYDPTGTVLTQKDGFISRVATSFYATLNAPASGQPIGTFDIAQAPVLEQTGTNPPSYQNATPGVTETVLPLRNPRFLKAYTPPGSTATTTSQDFLLADDDGVWDLFFNTNGQMVAQWGFTQADYQGLQAVNPATGVLGPAIIPGLTVSRVGVPFLPNSLSRIGTDPVTIGGTNYLMGHYLVTNGYSTGSVTPISGFGGEVLELGDEPATGPPALQTNLINSFNKLGTTGPLSQPTFANQEK